MPSDVTTPVDDGATQMMHAVMPLTKTLGIEALPGEPGETRARLAWREDLCTSDGMLHGGTLMALADACGGACAFMNLPEGAVGTSTIESKTNFMRAVREGYVEAVSRVLHGGRSTLVIETDLFDADERRVAKVIQTQTVLRPAS